MRLAIDGFSVYVAVSQSSGPADRPWMVLIHGAQHDHRTWVDQLQWFAAHGYMAIAPDLPGHGQSAGAPLATIELMGQWLATLLEAMVHYAPDRTQQDGATNSTARSDHAFSAQCCILVGHSMGSLAALECAAHHSASVNALVMVGTAFPMKVSPALLAQTRTDEVAAITQIAQWSYAPDATDAGQSDIERRRQRIQTAKQLMSSQAAGVLYSDLNACNSYQHGLESAKRISCPTLVVAASKDQMTPPKFATVLQQALAADFQTLDGAGHAMMNEQGEHFSATIHQFLTAHGLSPQVPVAK